MKDDSLHQPDPGPYQEKWVSKQEILKLFPFIKDRQLTYWRTKNKVIYKTVRNNTFYIASSVRLQVEKLEQPKKYWALRKAAIQKKLRTIDHVLAIAIVTSLFWFVTSTPIPGKKDYTIKDVSLGFKVILLICALYGLVKFIIYISARLINKQTPKE